ncbi:ribokinase [Primorskyibacter sp. S187A]|uniref:ribokinase n=1 Tax=Primorskyibacter sp. S187A TaxID=3415130 RepID=UPI003C7D8FB2
MTIFNIGSINIDKTYQVPHLPSEGETLAAHDLTLGLGGKGTNMSVAASRAAAHVVHIGAIGPEGRWTVDRMTEYGVDTRHICQVDAETGHAIIAVDTQGENLILLWPGANHCISEAQCIAALAESVPGDVFLTQNETNAQTDAARIARSRGMKVLYAAAPFSAEAVQAILPLTDLLVLNEVEAEQLEHSLGTPLTELGLNDVVVTLGADGCKHINAAGDAAHFPAFKTEVRDTTGAGDTFTGYLAAGLDRGQPMAQAIRTAQKAAALMVSRLGTADVIPDLKDVQDASF